MMSFESAGIPIAKSETGHLAQAKRLQQRIEALGFTVTLTGKAA